MPAGDDFASDLATTTTSYFDAWWDEDTALLWNPPGAYADLTGPATVHLVPQSAWYALGLLRRDGPGDRDRAARTLAALLALQYDEPGSAVHGTFARFAEWPHPPPDPVVWEDYDPNWRQFLGCAFGLARHDFAARLPEALAAALRHSIGLAVAGEPPDRVTARYSNIALMKAWLEVDHGSATADAALVQRGEDLAREVAALFDRHGAFDEYNSATYYGIDLYALALWEKRSPSAVLRDLGARLGAALWRDIALWYHAGLRNLAGPYTRSYSMDLTSSLGLLGLWIWAAAGRDAAPLPPIGDPGRPGAPGPAIDHGHDLALGPVIAHLGAGVPDDALGDLLAFPGERRVEQVLDGGRRATAWLARDVMIGAEGGGADWGGWDQVHLATVHWRNPSGGVGWLRLCSGGVVDARAEPGRLVARCEPPREGRPGTRLVLRTGPGASSFGRDAWHLPGLDVRPATTAPLGRVERGEGDLLEVPLSPPAARRAFDLVLDVAATAPRRP